MADIKTLIAPIIYETYGTGVTADSLIDYLARRIDNDWLSAPSDERERAIMLDCWNWFSGGTTAEATARKIEEALTEAGL